MSRPVTTVSTPTEPPSSQPPMRTVASMAMRIGARRLRPRFKFAVTRPRCRCGGRAEGRASQSIEDHLEVLFAIPTRPWQPDMHTCPRTETAEAERIGPWSSWHFLWPSVSEAHFSTMCRGRAGILSRVWAE